MAKNSRDIHFTVCLETPAIFCPGNTCVRRWEKYGCGSVVNIYGLILSSVCRGKCSMNFCHGRPRCELLISESCV